MFSGGGHLQNLQNEKNWFKEKLIYFPLIIIIATVFIFLVVLATNSLSANEVVLQDCKGDNFESMTYTFTDRHGNNHDRFLKYKFVEDSASDEYYTFDGALNACKELDSTLWGLVHGKEEWDSVIGMAKSEGKSSVWINGKVVGLCPGIKLYNPNLTSPHLTSPRLTSPHLTSPRLTLPHLTSPHLTSPHLTSPHLTSPHLTSPHLD